MIAAYRWIDGRIEAVTLERRVMLEMPHQAPLFDPEAPASGRHNARRVALPTGARFVRMPHPIRWEAHLFACGAHGAVKLYLRAGGRPTSEHERALTGALAWQTGQTMPQARRGA